MSSLFPTPRIFIYGRILETMELKKNIIKYAMGEKPD